MIDHFVDYFNRELGLAVSSVAPEARQCLLDYNWPGNVHELENTLCRSMILCKGNRTAKVQSLGISRKTLFDKMRQFGILD